MKHQNLLTLTVMAAFSVHCDSKVSMLLLLHVISTFNTRVVETCCNNRAHDFKTYMTVSYACAQYELTGASS